MVKQVILVFLGYIIFLLIGAYVFLIIEQPYEVLTCTTFLIFWNSELFENFVRKFFEKIRKLNLCLIIAFTKMKKSICVVIKYVLLKTSEVKNGFYRLILKRIFSHFFRSYFFLLKHTNLVWKFHLFKMGYREICTRKMNFFR